MSGDWNPSIDPDKTTYKSERIQLDQWPDGTFTDDRRDYGPNPVGFHINGFCPSCKHRSTALCATKYLAPDKDIEKIREVNGYADDAIKPAAITQVTVLRCACVQDHDTAPAGAFGCGTEWLLRVSYFPVATESSSTFLPVTTAESFHYWMPADNVANAIPNSLADAQAAAGKWQTVLAGFLVLFGVSAILGGRDTIQALNTRWQWALGTATLIALVANGIMLYQGNMAALGFPTVNDALSPRALRDADLMPLLQAESSVKKLRVAFWSTLLSGVAAIVATGIFLFA